MIIQYFCLWTHKSLQKKNSVTITHSADNNLLQQHLRLEYTQKGMMEFIHPIMNYYYYYYSFFDFYQHFKFIFLFSAENLHTSRENG